MSFLKWCLYYTDTDSDDCETRISLVMNADSNILTTKAQCAYQIMEHV